MTYSLMAWPKTPASLVHWYPRYALCRTSASTPAYVLCTQRSAPDVHWSARRANVGGSATITS